MNPRLYRLLTAWKGDVRPGIVPEQAPATRIPRIIHQVYFTPDGSGPPEAILQNIARIRAANPEWEHRLYDFNAMVAFIQEQYGAEVLHYFLKIRPEYGAARADLFRYLLIYKCGGLYLDIKSAIDRPLREVLLDDDVYLLSQWANGPGEPFERWGLYPELQESPGGEFQQWFILAAPGHPFLRAVILRLLTNLHRYDPAVDGTGWATVMRMTGPIPYTLAILPLLANGRYRRVASHGQLGLRYSIFDSPDRHHGLFRTHYSTVAVPLTRQSNADRIATALLYGARRLYRLVPSGN